MRHLRVRLPELLAQHRLNRRRLSQQVGLRYATLNDVYSGKRRPSLDTLEAILNGIEQLTGQPVALGDLLEVVTPPADQDLSDVADLRAALSAVEMAYDPTRWLAWHAAYQEASALPGCPLPRGAIALLNTAAPGLPAHLHPFAVLGKPLDGGLVFAVPLVPATDPASPHLTVRPGGVPAPSDALPLLARAVPVARLVCLYGELTASELGALQRTMCRFLEE